VRLNASFALICPPAPEVIPLEWPSSIFVGSSSRRCLAIRFDIPGASSGRARGDPDGGTGALALTLRTDGHALVSERRAGGGVRPGHPP
jgi:hypothetical protein